MRCLVEVPMTSPLECLLKADFYLPPPPALRRLLPIRATQCAGQIRGERLAESNANECASAMREVQLPILESNNVVWGQFGKAASEHISSPPPKLV